MDKILSWLSFAHTALPLAWVWVCNFVIALKAEEQYTRLH